MLTVTIDQSEGISGADIPEQAVKKMRTGSAALSLPNPRSFFAFLITERLSIPPPSRSLEQATGWHSPSGDQSVVYDEFKEQLRRSEEGWYETGLPWKGNHTPLPNNKEGSLRRLASLVRNLRRMDESKITML